MAEPGVQPKDLQHLLEAIVTVGSELSLPVVLRRIVETATELVDAICVAAHTGNRGDGMVAVTELGDLVRIRTGERGDAAA